MEDRRSNLVAGARRFLVELSQAAAETMLAYLDRLLDVNRTLNLTAVRDPVAGVDRHLLDSLAFGLHAAEAGPPRRVVDVGTGGGFPGVPIAIAWPGAEVLLLDATRKKVDAVDAIVRELRIANVRVRWSRAEDLRADAPVDAVTVRAVGSLSEAIRQAAPLLAPAGAVVTWKSEALPDGERAEAARAAASAGMESLPDLVYELGAKRRLVRFRRPGGP